MGFNLTPLVRNLLIINVIIWIFSQFTQGIFPIGLNNLLALRPIQSELFFPTQFFTYMFAHADFMHLFSNMLGLIVFGPMLETVWGTKRFLFFYLFVGVGAGLLYSGINFYESKKLESAVQYYIENPSPDNFSRFLQEDAHDRRYQNDYFTLKENYFDNENDPGIIQSSIEATIRVYSDKINNSAMLGASGAVLGILAAFGLLFPNTELFLLFFPFPIKAKYLVIFYAVYSIYAGIRKAPGDNVAHFTHIGGMIFAFILVKYWNYNRKKFY
jgi:membrane associated rhomboid family serine protease